MYTCEESIIINKPRQYVFAVAETYPLFVTFYRSREILFQDAQTMTVRIGSEILGMKTSWIGEGRKKRFESIEFTQTQGIFKGLLAVWNFEDRSSDVTSVTIHIRFSLNLPMIGKFLEQFLGNVKVKKTIRGILMELKRESEQTSPADILQK